MLILKDELKVRRLQEGNSNTRLCFVHNPVLKVSSIATQEYPSVILGRLISQGRLSKTSPSLLLDALGLSETPTLGEDNQVVMTSKDTLIDILNDSSVDSIEEAGHEEYLKSCQLLVRALNLSPGEQALVVNGRVGIKVSSTWFYLSRITLQVVGPLGDGDFLAEDIQSLATYEFIKRVEPVANALQEILEPTDMMERYGLNQTHII